MTKTRSQQDAHQQEEFGLKICKQNLCNNLFPREKNTSLVRHVVYMPIENCPKHGSSYNYMTFRLTQTRVAVVLRCISGCYELRIAIEST